MTDLPDGMVTIGGALAGFLTELEERCKRTDMANDRAVMRPIWHEKR